MNRTALSVIALAVGSVLIIGLFNIYKPAVSHVAHDVFNKAHIGNLSQPTTHTYKGVTFIDDGNGNVEAKKGTLNYNTDYAASSSSVCEQNSLVGPRSPKYLKEAKTIKFDRGVNTSHVVTYNWMFSGSNNLHSVDLGNAFDGTMGSQPSTYSMFEHDRNLENINFGSSFSKHGYLGTGNMFLSDDKLQKPTGSMTSNMTNSYNTRQRPAPGSWETN